MAGAQSIRNLFISPVAQNAVDVLTSCGYLLRVVVTGCSYVLYPTIEKRCHASTAAGVFRYGPNI